MSSVAVSPFSGNNNVLTSFSDNSQENAVIKDIHDSSNSTTINATTTDSTTESTTKKPIEWKKIGLKILEIVKKIFYVLVGVALYLSNPVIFGFGFCAGFIWTQETTNCIEKIKKAFDKYKWPIAIGLTASALLGLQFTVPLCSFVYAADLGANLSRKVNAAMKESREEQNVENKDKKEQKTDENQQTDQINRDTLGFCPF